MFKVIIADDEVYVVALIRKLVEWERFRMTVAGTANDGGSALALVREHHPDLVIVDIRMPEYDGITFMDKVREFNADVKFIVISGHKQFDYAKGAMRNNVEDYLLKPINKEELNAAVGRVYEGLVKTRRTLHRIMEMEEELDTSRKKLHCLLIDSVMKQEYEGTDESLEQINLNYLTDFQAGSFRFFTLHLDAPASPETASAYQLILKEAGKRFREELSGVCYDILDCEQGKKIVFLVNYPEEDWGMLRQKMSDLLAACVKSIKKFDNLTFRLCAAKSCNSCKTLENSRQSLWRLMLSRVVMPDGKMIEEEDIRESAVFLKAVLEYRGKSFEQSLESLNAEEIYRYMREMFSRASYGIEEDSLLYYKLFLALADRIWKYYSNIGISRETETQFKQQLEQDYLVSVSSTEYPRILYRKISSMIGENYLHEKNAEAPAIRIVKRYIREHYQEDISLPLLADLVNISPVYLSRLFKKEEGINFLDYLNQYRLEVSKKLLLDIRLSIIEVAVLSGFRQTKYFSRMFKKAAGITPSEYRRRHLGKDTLQEGTHEQ